MTTVAAGLLVQSAAAALNVPAWDFKPGNNAAVCVDATTDSPPTGWRLQHGGAVNARWVYYALPEGTPPPGGWPVFLSLVTDNFAAPVDVPAGSKCGGGGGGYSRAKPFTAFATPNETMTTCFESPPPAPALEAGADGPFCSFELKRYCRAEEKEGSAKCLACAGQHASELQKVNLRSAATNRRLLPPPLAAARSLPPAPARRPPPAPPHQTCCV